MDRQGLLFIPVFKDNPAGVDTVSLCSCMCHTLIQSEPFLWQCIVAAHPFKSTVIRPRLKPVTLSWLVMAGRPLVASSGCAAQECSAQAAVATCTGRCTGGPGGPRDIQGIRAVHLAAAALELCACHSGTVWLGCTGHPAFCWSVSKFYAILL